MTDQDIPRPLRRQLLLRASVTGVNEQERDRIIRVFFPGLNIETTLPRLEEAAVHRQFGRLRDSEQIVSDLIKEDLEART